MAIPKNVSIEIMKERIAICHSCDQWSKGVCRACGCYTTYKVKKDIEKCPLNKWGPQKVI